MTYDQETPQQLFIKSAVLHLIPGIFIVLFYLLVNPSLMQAGFNSSFGLLLAFLLVGIPTQLAILFNAGYKLNGRLTLKGVVLYTEKLPYWQYIAFPLAFILWAILISTLLGELHYQALIRHFYWLPDWLFLDSSIFPSESSLTIIAICFTAVFLIDGILNPIVEEIYFRGYLLPRISRFKLWAPILHAGLFSLAHLWQPWNYIQIFLMVLPVYYVVVWKRNIYLAMITHCLANIIGGIFILLQYVSG